MSDVIIIVVLVVILGVAIAYMNKERPSGVNCIGCPDAPVCAMKKRGQTCKGKDNSSA